MHNCTLFDVERALKDNQIVKNRTLHGQKKMIGQIKPLLHFLNSAFAYSLGNSAVASKTNGPLHQTRDCFQFADFELDTRNRRIIQRGVSIRCGAKTFDLLVLLVSNAGTLVTRDAIRDELWRGRTVEFDQAINNCVRDARRLLGDTVKTPSFIKTIPKHGYVFICPVSIQANFGDSANTRWSPAQA